MYLHSNAAITSIQLTNHSRNPLSCINQRKLSIEFSVLFTLTIHATRNSKLVNQYQTYVKQKEFLKSGKNLRNRCELREPKKNRTKAYRWILQTIINR